MLVFDDSFVQWVENAGAATRYTLMITFWHPDLSWLERVFLGLVLRMGKAQRGRRFADVRFLQLDPTIDRPD